MHYEEFRQMVKERMELVYPDKQIHIMEVVKNNGVILDGLMVMEAEEDTAPSIYLNDYYNIYGREQEPDMDLIIRDIVDVYETCRRETPLDVEKFRDYSYMRDKICWKLISYERNADLLEEVPHVRYLDMAVVFFCLLEHERLGCSTILIYQSHMELWGITLEQLYERARENSKQLLGYEVKNIYDTMDSLMKENFGPESGMSGEWQQGYSGLPMYVLTTRMQMYGAACMLYEEVLEACREMLGGDFYILPGSIHELILLPASKTKNGHMMEQMVSEINGVYVQEEDVLSDHVYLYDSRRREVLSVYRQGERTS